MITLEKYLTEFATRPYTRADIVETLSRFFRCGECKGQFFGFELYVDANQEYWCYKCKGELDERSND